MTEEEEYVKMILTGVKSNILDNYIRKLKRREQDYKSRIDKAIEYLEKKWEKEHYYEDIENCMTFCEYEKEDLLNILKGNDKE